MDDSLRGLNLKLAMVGAIAFRACMKMAVEKAQEMFSGRSTCGAGNFTPALGITPKTIFADASKFHSGGVMGGYDVPLLGLSPIPRGPGPYASTGYSLPWTFSENIPCLTTLPPGTDQKPDEVKVNISFPSGISATNAPRPYTSEELTEAFYSEIWTHVDQWANVEGRTRREICSGLAFSILAMLDGDGGEMPVFDLIARPSPEDEAYCISNSERWVQDGTVLMPWLHERFYKASSAKEKPVSNGSQDGQPSPIEVAPRDGTHLLLWDEEWRLGHYGEGRHGERGWQNGERGDEWPAPLEPTHFLFLPEGPKDGE